MIVTSRGKPAAGTNGDQTEHPSNRSANRHRELGIHKPDLTVQNLDVPWKDRGQNPLYREPVGDRHRLSEFGIGNRGGLED